MEEPVMNEETEAEFAQRMNVAINEGFMTLGLAIGSKLGLFDLLISFDKPKTSQEIADAGGFKERYIGCNCPFYMHTHACTHVRRSRAHTRTRTHTHTQCVLFLSDKRIVLTW